ncbi:MAG: FAD:protein FMN transferase [Coriobacteriaceae bacterium]|nr:FAD:protein FMN transferase [Coriobacteriaceae bacterium]
MQRYVYGDIEAAEPYEGEDGSRVISFFIFNTEVHLHAYPGDGATADEFSQLDEALKACRDRCQFFEERLSRMRETSDIARAHAASPRPVRVAPETAELICASIGYCERSRGCFDITMGTVTRLWDFHAGVVPSKLALFRALPHVGYEKIHVDAGGPAPQLSIDDAETVLDVGGIAKGYIADDLAGLLERAGVVRFAINLGGNVLVRGGRPGDAGASPAVRAGDAWSVGIVNPRDPAHMRAIVRIADGSVVTSGLHERRFTKGGVTYHHILSPADGMPARTDVASATIIAPRSIDCDGYSTTVLMLGMEEGLAFAEGIDGIEAVLISSSDEVRWTEGIGERLSLVPTLPRW